MSDRFPSSAPPHLSGLRVLELGSFIAAPFAGRLFADFGADVIKIERPGTGDELRTWRRHRGTTSMMFRTIARNKRSVTLDLRTERGREIALELVRTSDVVMENFRPGTLERWGLGPEQLAEVNPDVELVRISGYGQTGPNRDHAGFGGVAEAFGGLRHVTGHPDREAVRPAAPLGDVLAGMYGVIGALMSLLSKARNGSPQRVNTTDVALYEAVYTAMESLVPDYDAYGTVRSRTGGSLPGVVPGGTYPTSDGQPVMIAGNSSAVFVRLMEAVGRPDLAQDPALRDGQIRGEREEELNGVIGEWTRQRTGAEAIALLNDAGVPAGPVYDAPGIAQDQHYQERGMHRTMKVRVEDEWEDVRFPGIVPRVEAAPGRLQWVGPDLGQHTEEVLGDMLGLSPRDIDSLRTEGVV